jgi:hypothetical protein
VLCEDWLMMLAWPDTTVAPVGFAAAGWASVSADTRQLVAIRPARRRTSRISPLCGTLASLIATYRIDRLTELRTDRSDEDHITVRVSVKSVKKSTPTIALMTILNARRLC